jgi:hypothetical protein
MAFALLGNSNKKPVEESQQLQNVQLHEQMQQQEQAAIATSIYSYPVKIEQDPKDFEDFEPCL